MIQTEILPDGLIRTYSDQNFKIRQDGTGVIYDEAIDPIKMNRTYTETTEKNIEIEIEEETL